VIPIFETISSSYEERVGSYSGVNYDEPDAPEDHIAINLRVAWAKANEYFVKLDDSPRLLCRHLSPSSVQTLLRQRVEGQTRVVGSSTVGVPDALGHI
jgi:hypothetical protein